MPLVLDASPVPAPPAAAALPPLALLERQAKAAQTKREPGTVLLPRFKRLETDALVAGMLLTGHADYHRHYGAWREAGELRREDFTWPLMGAVITALIDYYREVCPAYDRDVDPAEMRDALLMADLYDTGTGAPVWSGVLPVDMPVDMPVGRPVDVDTDESEETSAGKVTGPLLVGLLSLVCDFESERHWVAEGGDRFPSVWASEGH